MKRSIDLEKPTNQTPEIEGTNPPPSKRARTSLAGRDVSTEALSPPLPLPPSQPSASSPPEAPPPSPIFLLERAKRLAQSMDFAEDFQIEQKLAEVLPYFSFNGTARDERVLCAILSLYKRTENIRDHEDSLLLALQESPEPKERATQTLLHTLHWSEEQRITGHQIFELFQSIKAFSDRETILGDCKAILQRRGLRNPALLLVLFRVIASFSPTVPNRADIDSLTALLQQALKKADHQDDLETLIDELCELGPEFLLTHLSYLHRAAKEYDLTSNSIFAFIETFSSTIHPTLVEEFKFDFAKLLRMAQDRGSDPDQVATLFAQLASVTTIVKDEDEESVKVRYREIMQRITNFASRKHLKSIKDIQSLASIFVDKGGHAAESLDQLNQLLRNFFQVDRQKTRGDDAVTLLSQVAVLGIAYEAWKKHVQEKSAPELLLRSALLVLGYGGLSFEYLPTVVQLLGGEDSEERLEAVMASYLPILKGMPEERSFEAVQRTFYGLSALPSEQLVPYVHRLLQFAQERGVRKLPLFVHVLREAPAPAKGEEFNNLLDHAERIARMSGTPQQDSNETAAITALLRILVMLPRDSRGVGALTTLYQRFQLTRHEIPTTSFLVVMATRIPQEQRLNWFLSILREEESFSPEGTKSPITLFRAACATIALRSLPSEEEEIRAHIRKKSPQEIRLTSIEALFTPPFLLQSYLFALIEAEESSTDPLLPTLLDQGGEQLKNRLHSWLIESAERLVEEHPITAQFFLAQIAKSTTLIHLQPDRPATQRLLGELLPAVILHEGNTAVPLLPLRVHRELRLWANEPFSLPEEAIGETRLSWNPRKIQEMLSGQQKYTREDLPEGVVFADERNVFFRVFSGLQQRLQEAYPSGNDLPREDAEVLQKMVVFLSNPTVQRLLSPTNPQVSEHTFYLYKLGEELLQKKPNKPPNERFSEQEEWLKVVAEGVQHCEQGVEEGIFQTYQLMQSLRGESPEDLGDASIQASANRVHASLEKLCLDYLRTKLNLSDEFIGEVAEEKPQLVKQLPHQRHYLQQLIHPLFGAPVRRDSHTETLLHRIVEKARNAEGRAGIRRLFFAKHMPLHSLFSSIESKINTDINDFSPQKKMFGLRGLIRFLEKKDPNAENVAKYFEEEEAGTYKVRKEAVVEILQRLGVVATPSSDQES